MTAQPPPLEIEAKFTLEAPEVGDALAEAGTLGDDIALGVVTEKVDQDDYADTDDLALLRAGWALRHRTRFITGAEGWPSVKHVVTLKQLAGAATLRDGVHVRAEHEGPVVGPPFDTAGWPDDVRLAAEAAIGGAVPPLAELFTLAQRRRVRAVTLYGATVGELSIGAGRLHLPGDIRGGADAIASFDEVEVELVPGATMADLARVVPALSAASGGRAALGGKFDRAVELLAAAPAVASLPSDERARLARALSILGARDGDGV